MAGSTSKSKLTKKQVDQKMEDVAEVLFSQIDRMVDEAGGTEAYVAKQQESTPISKLNKLFANSVSQLENIGL